MWLGAPMLDSTSLRSFSLLIYDLYLIYFRKSSKTDYQKNQA